MIDVDEIYRVPKSDSNTNIINSLTEVLGKVSLGTNTNQTRRDEPRGDIEVNLNLYKSGNFNLFQRHVNQMLIRGDNVVFVVLAD